MRLEHNWAVRKAKPTDSCVLLHFVQSYHLAICCSKLVLQSIITSVTISARACHCHCHQSSSNYLSFLFSLGPDCTRMGGYYFGLDETNMACKECQKGSNTKCPGFYLKESMQPCWIFDLQVAKQGERWHMERDGSSGTNFATILAPMLHQF